MNQQNQRQPLRIEALQLLINGNALFSPLTMTVAAGEILTVMGPSGSGKSSILSWLAGLLPEAFKAHGQCFIGDQNISALPCHLRRVGLQFQDDLLFPHLSVGENIQFALHRSDSKDLRRQRAAQLLAQAGLEGFHDRDPATLSGGQRARVALMRTLANQPRVLLLDEPFNRLDSHLKHEMREFVFNRVREQGLPTVLVTHDHADAQAAGGLVIELS